jgi:Zn-dependent peptidase ImmA (M78 family)/DNA-binding XRE family transcriptional regulator
MAIGRAARRETGMGDGDDVRASNLEALGSRLARVREARRLSQDDVAEVLGVTRVLVSHWERGQRRPSEAVLERLALIYGVDLTTLLEAGDVPDRPDLAELLFRDAEGGVDAQARTGLGDFVQFLEKYSDLIESLGSSFDFVMNQSPFVIRRGFTGKDDIRRKAQDVREWLGLGLGPVGDLPGLLDEMGITLYRTPLGNNLETSVSGAFLNHPRLGFSIAVNTDTTPGRQVFTMAHELAHALLHSHKANRIVSYWSRRDENERYADIWAGEFLVPSEGLRRASERLGIKTVSDPTEVVQLQRHFSVSYGMMLLRLLQTRLLGKGAYDHLKDVRPVVLASHLGYDVDTEEWGPDPHRWRLERFPRRFVRVVASALRTGDISPPTAAGLMDVTLDEITELLSSPGDADPDLREELREMDNVRERATG